MFYLILTLISLLCFNSSNCKNHHSTKLTVITTPLNPSDQAPAVPVDPLILIAQERISPEEHNGLYNYLEKLRLAPENRTSPAAQEAFTSYTLTALLQNPSIRKYAPDIIAEYEYHASHERTPTNNE